MNAAQVLVQGNLVAFVWQQVIGLCLPLVAMCIAHAVALKFVPVQQGETNMVQISEEQVTFWSKYKYTILHVGVMMVLWSILVGVFVLVPVPALQLLCLSLCMSSFGTSHSTSNTYRCANTVSIVALELNTICATDLQTSATLYTVGKYNWHHTISNFHIHTITSCFQQHLPGTCCSIIWHRILRQFDHCFYNVC